MILVQSVVLGPKSARMYHPSMYKREGYWRVVYFALEWSPKPGRLWWRKIDHKKYRKGRAKAVRDLDPAIPVLNVSHNQLVNVIHAEKLTGVKRPVATDALIELM